MKKILLLMIISFISASKPMAIVVRSTDKVEKCSFNSDCSTIYPGSLIFTDDIIKTRSGSYTKIRFLDIDCDIKLYDKSKAVFKSGNAKDMNSSMMLAYGDILVSTDKSLMNFSTPHLSFLNSSETIFYISVDAKSNEKVYVIDGGIDVKENSFITSSEKLDNGKMISFIKKAIISDSPKRIVKRIINRDISFNENIPDKILKEYNISIKNKIIEEKTETLVIPMRNAKGEFKKLVIEYVID